MYTQEYNYDALPANHIRLLSVAPRPAQGVISLTLRTVPLYDAAGKYDAISYTWGQFLPVREVMIDGKRLWVQDNIWRFLRQCCLTALRKKHHQDLWIDSICINQGDVPEKNIQVQQMAAIFTQAKQVIVWLGEASRLSKWAESTAGRYSTMSRYMRETHDYSKVLDIEDIVLREDIRRMMLAPYWTRLWIVQELALAQQVMVVSGIELFNLTDLLGFSALAKYFYQIHAADGEDICWHKAAKQVDQLVERHLHRETQLSSYGLAPLVESFAAQQCCDPHDRVYGVLGLLQSGKKLKVDYSIDMEALFWQVLHATHEELGELTSGTRRDSYQWSLELLLKVLGLQLSDVLCHKLLKQQVEQDRFAVEMKINGRLALPVSGFTDTRTEFFSLTVRRYYYGELCILIDSEFSLVKLAYVYDPLLYGYGEKYDNNSVEIHELDAPKTMRRDLVISLQEQQIRAGMLATNADTGGSFSVRFAFRSLIEFSRLDAIGEEYLQGEKNDLGRIIGPQNWSDGFPWTELMGKVATELNLIERLLESSRAGS